MIEICMVKETTCSGGPVVTSTLFVHPEQDVEGAGYNLQRALECHAEGCVKELAFQGFHAVGKAEVVDHGMLHVYEIWVEGKKARQGHHTRP